jgi:hypothetical protein
LAFFISHSGFDPIVNRLGDTIKIVLHLPVGEPQEPNPQGLQLLLSVDVLTSFELVRITIDLHRQHQLGREEIHDEFVDRSLAVKIDAASLSSLEMAPQQDLRQRAPLPQLPGEAFEIWIVAKHRDWGLHTPAFCLAAERHPSQEGIWSANKRGNVASDRRGLIAANATVHPALAGTRSAELMAEALFLEGIRERPG